MKKQNKTLLEILGSCVFTLSGIYAVNKIIFSIAQGKSHLFSSESELYKHKHGNIHYTASGSGSPLLLIHELDSSSSSYEWHEVISDFSKNHTVYALDLLGCGFSSKPAITYTSYLYTQLIHDFIKDVICDVPDIIATGISSSLVVMTEKMHPGTIGKMLFVNPADFEEASHYPTEMDMYQKKLLDSPIIGTAIYNLYHSKAALLKRFCSDFLNSDSKNHVKYLRRYHEAAHLGGSSSKYLFSSLKCHYFGCNIENSYSSITNSICVILGEEMDSTIDMADYSVCLNPNTEVAIIPNSKYLPQIDASEAFFDVCNTFLTEGTIE